MSILKKNIVFNLLGQFMVILLSFVSFKYLYSGVGEDALGLIYFSLMIGVLLSSALDMGLTKTTVRELALHCYSEPVYIRKLIQTFSFFYFLAYLIVSILFVVFSRDIIDYWIILTTMKAEVALHVFLVIGVSSLLSIPKMFLSSICVGLQKMGVNNLIDTLAAALQQLGMLVLLINGNDIFFIAYWIAFTNILKILTYFVFISNMLSVKVLFPIFSIDVVQRVKEYTKKMLLVSFMLVIHKQIDKLLISKLLPIGILGVYSFVFISIGKTSLITSAIAQAAFPAFSEMEKKGQRQEIVRRFILLQELLVFCTLPIFASVIFFSIPLFTYLLDEQKAETLQVTIVLLAISFYMNAVLRLVRTYMFAINNPNPIIRSDFISLFIVIPLAFLLVLYFGINGAALSWVIFYFLMALFIIPAVYKKEFNLPAIEWLKPVFFAVLLAIITYLPAGYFCSNIYSGEIHLFVICFSLASIFYAMLALNFVGISMQMSIISYFPFLRFVIITNYGKT